MDFSDRRQARCKASASTPISVTVENTLLGRIAIRVTFYFGLLVTNSDKFDTNELKLLTGCQ